MGWAKRIIGDTSENKRPEKKHNPSGPKYNPYLSSKLVLFLFLFYFRVLCSMQLLFPLQLASLRDLQWSMAMRAMACCEHLPVSSSKWSSGVWGETACRDKNAVNIL